MNARDTEAALLTRCVAVARAESTLAQDPREANVFRLAGMVVRSRLPDESTRLMQASDQYFAEHPKERLPAVEVVRNGWVVNLPRLRDMLSHQLDRH